jgi:hypothetical protein
MEKNYITKNYFDHAEYMKLFDVVSSDKDMVEAVDDALTECRNYVNVVDTTEQQIMLAQVRFEGEEYRNAITRYDIQRRRAHESAIASANMLNRIAGLYGCQTIYKGGEDRLEVADFCLEVTVKLFQNRTK